MDRERWMTEKVSVEVTRHERRIIHRAMLGDIERLGVLQKSLRDHASPMLIEDWERVEAICNKAVVDREKILQALAE